MPANPLVSVVVVVRNGRRNILEALESICQQDYSPLEIIVVDGLSEDGTPALVQEFAQTHSQIPIRLRKNPQLIQATGWNIGIRAAQGDYVLRLDAVHCKLEQQYIRRCLEKLLSWQTADPAVVAVGGRRISVSTALDPWSEAIAAAQCSRFGVGNAAYRLSETAGFVDTLGVPLYRKDKLLGVGLFNESLGRSEDNELHARLRRAGFKLYFLPDCAAFYQPRTSLRSLASQMFHNGWWVSATIVRLCRFPFGARHIIPFALYLALALSAGLGIAGFFWARVAFAVLLAVYVGSSLLGAFYAIRAHLAWRVATVFWVMHACYAGGTLAGLFAGRRGAAIGSATSPGTNLRS